MWQTAPDGGMHPSAGAGPAVGYGGPPMGAVGAPLNGSPNLTEIGRAYSEALKLLTNQAEKPVYNMLSMLAVRFSSPTAPRIVPAVSSCSARN